MSVRLTVITVTRNDSAGLRRTARSLSGYLEVNDKETEWIVVDGSDKEYHDINRQTVRSAGPLLIQETDKGPYDAMDKGLSASSGRWVWFLNGGDSATTGIRRLTRIMDRYEDSVDHLVFPVFLCRIRSVNKAFPQSAIQRFGISGRLITRQHLRLRNPICHQGIISKRDHAGPLSDPRFPILADYAHWIQEFLVRGSRFQEFPIPIANYVVEGLSAGYGRRILDEERQLRQDRPCIERIGLWLKTALHRLRGHAFA